MTNSVQRDYKTHADPSEPPIAEALGEVTSPDGKKYIVLQVNNSGQPQKFRLSIDAVREKYPTSPAVAEALRGIAKQLKRLADAHGAPEETG